MKKEKIELQFRMNITENVYSTKVLNTYEFNTPSYFVSY